MLKISRVFPQHPLVLLLCLVVHQVADSESCKMNGNHELLAVQV